MAYIQLQTARQTFKLLKRVARQGFIRDLKEQCQVFFELKKEILETCSHSYTNLLTQFGSPQAVQ